MNTFLSPDAHNRASGTTLRLPEMTSIRYVMGPQTIRLGVLHRLKKVWFESPFWEYRVQKLS
jgi:hypothetical protein